MRSVRVLLTLILSVMALTLASGCRTTGGDSNESSVKSNQLYGTVAGTYDGHGFKVRLNGPQAVLTWNDGTQGFDARHNPNPNPQPRCPCSIYDGPDGRRITVELGPNNTLRGVTYERNGSGGGSTSNSISGIHDGHRFKVRADGNKAILTWDDGTQGFTARRNHNPNPQPRCPCEVYDGPDGRQLTLHLDLQNGGYQKASYSRNGGSNGGTSHSISGTYQNYTFKVQADGNEATLTWDDGTQGFTAQRNHNPNPQPRCPCEVYDGPDGRQLILHLDLQNGGYQKADYSRN